MLVAIVAHSRVRLAVLVIGLLAGRGAMPHATRTRDSRIIWSAIGATAIAILIGEYLVTSVLARQLATELGRPVTTPIPLGQLWPLLTATGDAGAMVLTWLGACVAAMLPVRHALRADERPAPAEKTALAEEEAEEEEDVRPARPVERVRRDRASATRGGAKISCAKCGDLVGLATTVREADGNYCPDCALEAHDANARRLAESRSMAKRLSKDPPAPSALVPCAVCGMDRPYRTLAHEDRGLVCATCIGAVAWSPEK